MRTIRICLLLSAGVCAASGQTPAEAGLAIYRRHCTSCHGAQADGGRAPDLTHGSLSETQMVNTISSGVPGTEMAAYGSRLSSEEIRRIVAFLNSANSQSAVAGDAARGQTLFWEQGGCARCHAVGNRGSFVGPDLSGIGKQRNVVYLRESLVAPSADIARGYEGVTVTLPDGKTLRGVERSLDDFSVVLQDFTGKVYSFDRASVGSVTRDKQSLMPDYSQTLSAADVNDVVAYLATLRDPRFTEARRR